MRPSNPVEQLILSMLQQRGDRLTSHQIYVKVKKHHPFARVFDSLHSLVGGGVVEEEVKVVDGGDRQWFYRLSEKGKAIDE